MKCSTASSVRSRSRCSIGSTSALKDARRAWTLRLILLCCVVLLLASASGCAANRTIFVPESSPMRLGPNARARVWVRVDRSKEWELSGNEVEIPEGWWIVPSSYVNEELIRADGK